MTRSGSASAIKHVFGAALLASAMFAAGTASAALISCPNPVGATQDREYRTTGATDCVWGDGNIGQGNPGNDAFLLGQGTNDTAYGNTGSQFGKTWTTIDSGNYVNPGWGLSGLTISNYDTDSFDWLLTDINYAFYALGLKDGGTPKWAVFLLDSTSGVAEIISSGGSWSHVVLYGSGTPTGNGGGPGNGNDVPEPATLGLIGLSMLAMAGLRRRRADSIR